MIWIKAVLRGCALFLSMEDRASLLRRRIALYRRYLREGVDAMLAAEYLRQLGADEVELAVIEADERH
jgi:hypothetical protein